MSSTDQAPEPTMEEILASIRRIISEEENNDAPEASAAEGQDDEILDISEEQPVAGAPEGDASFTEEPVEELTAEADEPATLGDDEILELGDLTAEPVEAEAAPQTPPAQEAPAQEAPAQEPPVEEPAAPQDFAPEQPSPEPAGEDEPLELTEDFAFKFEEEEQGESGDPLVRETSALEAAIAALKGDQARSAEAEPQKAPETGSFPADEGAWEDLSQPPSDPGALEPDPVPEHQIESALQEAAAEDEAEEDFELATDDLEDDDALEEDAAAFAVAKAKERRNGVGAHHEPAEFGAYTEAGHSLEETVKSMLRPMLRDWLDQNMDRLLQEALREELQAEGKVEAKTQGH